MKRPFLCLAEREPTRALALVAWAVLCPPACADDSPEWGSAAQTSFAGVDVPSHDVTLAGRIAPAADAQAALHAMLFDTALSMTVESAGEANGRGGVANFQVGKATWRTELVSGGRLLPGATSEAPDTARLAFPRRATAELLASPDWAGGLERSPLTLLDPAAANVRGLESPIVLPPAQIDAAASDMPRPGDLGRLPLLATP